MTGEFVLSARRRRKCTLTPAEMDRRIVRLRRARPLPQRVHRRPYPGLRRARRTSPSSGPACRRARTSTFTSSETPGFNIGAAGQPPKCRNSLHLHRTAEVFFVLKGRWRFFWGRWGTAGEVVLEEGDVFDIPTGIFRGFENVGDDYGMLMAILGGDDAGGGGGMGAAGAGGGAGARTGPGRERQALRHPEGRRVARGSRTDAAARRRGARRGPGTRRTRCWSAISSPATGT